jgi:hypothetical protein
MLDPYAPLRSLPPLALIASLGLALAPAGAAAQIPDEFVNLQLLPQDISKDELVATMSGWAEDLGVRCGHCHVGPDDLQGMDFATDEREAKEVTREMLVLTRAINHDYLKDPQAGEDVTCHTCHLHHSSNE